MKGNERETILYGSQKVDKGNAQIELRGELDSLMAQAVFACAFARQYAYTDILSGAEDIVRVVRELVNCEGAGKPPAIGRILGLDFDELRHISHNPQMELGIPHYFPDEHTDDMTATLNKLRTDVRRAERAAARAPENEVNDSIQLVLNRLSSAIYILMLENRAERYG